MAVFELRAGPGEYGKGETRIFPFISESEPWIRRMEENKSNFPRLLGEVDVSSWLEAKRAFNYPLTPLQKRILSHEATHFEMFGRHGPLIGKARPGVTQAMPEASDATQSFINQGVNV